MVVLIVLIPARGLAQWEWGNNGVNTTKKQNAPVALPEFAVLFDSAQIETLNEILVRKKLNTQLCEAYIYVKALYVKNKFVKIHTEPYNLDKDLRKFLVKVFSNYKPNLRPGFNLDTALPPEQLLLPQNPHAITYDSLLGTITVSKKTWKNKTPATGFSLTPFFNLTSYYAITTHIQKEITNRNITLPACGSAITFDYDLTFLNKGKVKINKAYHNQKSLLFIDSLIEQNLRWDSAILYKDSGYQKINTLTEDTLNHAPIPAISIPLQLFFQSFYDYDPSMTNKPLPASLSKKRAHVKLVINTKSYYSGKQSTLNGDSTSIIDVSTNDSTQYFNFSQIFKMKYGENYKLKLPDNNTVDISLVRIHSKAENNYYFFIRNTLNNYSVTQIDQVENAISFSIYDINKTCYYYGSLIFTEE